MSLLKTFGSDCVLTGEMLKGRYAHIWRMDQPLTAKAILLPTSTEEVSRMLQYCHANNQSIILHGGLTNLVGGTEADADQVVMSLEKMNNVLEVDTKSRTMTVEAGVILENIHEAADEKELLFPLTFGAKGSAQVGGIISTNAGGLRVFRFGMTRQLILGLEVVLADGTILSSLKTIIKDNSGYDLKQLFIGAEGTLGVITKAVLKLVEKPSSQQSAFVALNDYEKVVQLLKFTDQQSAGRLSGFELIWQNSYQAMTSPPAHNAPPLPQDYTYYVLLETLGSHPEEDQQQLESMLEMAFEKEIIADAAIAYTESDLEWFWNIREHVEALKNRCRHDHHFDISIPIGAIGNTIEDICNELKTLPEVNHIFPFGHVADGNIHLIVDKANLSKDLKQKIDNIVYAPIKDLNGSVSAEHGIGIDKKAYLSLSKSVEEITTMQLLKKTFDPNNILNPGRIF